MKINDYIDHTLLKPIATTDQILQLCDEAIEHRFKAVCIPPFYLEVAKKRLAKSGVKLCTVIGFPFGYDHVAVKMEAIARAIVMGADELDAVINIPAVKNNNWDLVENEIESLVTAVKLKGNKVLKLILETAYLTVEELEILCNLCTKCGVDYAKTSTGYAPRGASLEDVILMKKTLGKKVKIKASGGIRDKEFALKLITAGANRLGTSSGIKLL